MKLLGILILVMVAACTRKEVQEPTPTQEPVNQETSEQSVPVVASVAKIQGVVKSAQGESGAWGQLQSGAKLLEDQRVKTTSESNAQINLFRGGRLELNKASELMLINTDASQAITNLGLSEGSLFSEFSSGGSGNETLVIKTPLGWVKTEKVPGVFRFLVDLQEKYFVVAAEQGNIEIHWQGKFVKVMEGETYRKRIRRRADMSLNLNEPPKPLPVVKEVTKFAVISPEPKSKIRESQVKIIAEVVDEQSVYFQGEKLIVENNQVEVETYLSPGTNTFIFQTILNGVSEDYRYEINRVQ